MRLFATSKMRLFADDCLLYRPVTSPADCDQLQQDLDLLDQWSSKWQMKFNVDKCHILRFSLRRNNLIRDYHLGGEKLSTVNEYLYLGLTLASNLSWQSHITNTTKKANRILGLLRRNLRGCPQKLRQQAYISLVRPHLEYTSTVWNPHTKKAIDQIEMIQRRAARFALSRYHRRDIHATRTQVGHS
jgi:hypothetical protein